MLPHTLIATLYCTVAYFLGQRWVRFGIVGVLATLSYFVPAFYFDRAGIPVFVNNTLSYLIGFVVSYTGQRTWTFQSKASHGSTLPKFLAVQVCGFGLNTFIIWLGMYMGLTYIMSMSVAIVCIPAVTYIINKVWVFRVPAAYASKVPHTPESLKSPVSPNAPDTKSASCAASPPATSTTSQSNEVK